MSLRPFISGIFLFLASGQHGHAQFMRNLFQDIEVFSGVGTTSYFGDIGGKDSKITGARALFDNLDIDLWQVRAMATAGLRVNPYKYLAFSVQLSPIWLSGNDQRSNLAWRGYSFKTMIWETSLQAEIYMADRITGFAPFALTGVSGMFYNFKNSLMAIGSRWYGSNSFIFGLGTRFPSKTRFTHSIDAAFHFTTTDSLDGYKTPKNSKDMFFIVSYKINFQLYTSWYYDHKGLVR